MNVNTHVKHEPVHATQLKRIQCKMKMETLVEMMKVSTESHSFNKERKKLLAHRTIPLFKLINYLFI